MTRKQYEEQVGQARSALVKHAKKRGMSADDAEDITQDTMMIALTRTNWQGIKEVRRYMIQVTENLVRNAKRKQVPITGLDTVQIVDQTACTSEIDALVDRLERYQERSEKLDAICAAMASAGLTEREKHVIQARLQGVPDAETARTLCITTDAVRAYHSQATRKIAAQIGQNMLVRGDTNSD